VLLDEPLSALDRQLRDRLASDLRDILTGAGVSAIFVTHDHEEAFTVADTMALMRASRVVQQGSLAEVWRRPFDREAALFLGYADVLEPGVAQALTERAGVQVVSGPLALRRSALRASPSGPLVGRVVSRRPTPDVVRLTVEIPDLGVMNAVADRSARAEPGEAVGLVLDLDRCAGVGEDHTGEPGRPLGGPGTDE
jgi:thiamine transport system ATP-binding protein